MTHFQKMLQVRKNTNAAATQKILNDQQREQEYQDFMKSSKGAIFAKEVSDIVNSIEK